MGFLTPQPVTDPRPGPDGPTSREALLYLRSYLVLRALVGVIGVALPFVLVGVSHLLLGESPWLRTSLSAYYYSGAREVFTGSLVAAGAFLVTYKVAERSLDNTLSLVAGVAALVVAGFPTGRDPGSSIPLTGLQERLGEGVVQAVHFTAAAVFIGSLAAISYFFGRREGDRPQERATGRARYTPQFWRAFHWTCAGLIVLAVAYLLLRQVVRGDDYALLETETVSALAFGASWLAKGLELDVLRGAPDPGLVSAA